MKRALIIGTSHSEATCQDSETGMIERIPRGKRWQDNLENYGYEVTTLARAACTMQHQFLVTYCYLQDNPDIHYDLVIIEGRAMEANMSIPVPSTDKFSTESFDNEELYHRWLTDITLKRPEELEFTRVDPGDVLDTFPEYAPYVADYLHSVLHGVDTWAVNLAMIKMLEKRANVVKWLTFSTSEKYNFSNLDSKPLKELNMGKVLLGDYLLHPSQWPCVDFTLADGFDKDVYCICNHFNEKGHKLFWEVHIKPYIMEYL